MTRRRWIADRVESDRAWLLAQNAAHLFRVLRVQAGEEFEVVVHGVLRQGTVVRAAEHEVEFQLGREVPSATLPTVNVYLSIFKFDRLEWALEKLTELGAARITPIIAQHSGQHLVKAAPARLARWRKIVHEAAQQARRIAPPEIAEPVALKKIVSSTEGTRIVLSEAEQNVSIKTALTNSDPPIALGFGPEGGWAPEEIKMFSDAGWKAASLGHLILRAETAAIAALSIAMAFLGHRIAGSPNHPI